MRDVQNYIATLKLSPQKRRQMHRALARKVAGYARQNTRKQQTPDGHAFAARAKPNPAYDDGKKRGKMLKKIAREKHMKAIGDEHRGKVYWSDGLMGKIAARQQYGARIDKTHRKKGNANYSGDKPATHEQAMRLISLGAKIRDRGFKPSVHWIRANLTIKRAGFLIRELGGQQSSADKSFILPSRSFLGVSVSQNTELTDLIVKLLVRLQR